MSGSGCLLSHEKRKRQQQKGPVSLRLSIAVGCGEPSSSSCLLFLDPLPSMTSCGMCVCNLQISDCMFVASAKEDKWRTPKKKCKSNQVKPQDRGDKILGVPKSSC